MKSLKSLALTALLSFAAAGAWASDAADEFIRAIKQDSGSGMTALLRQGVDPNTRDPRGVPGLYLALQEGSLDAAKAILAAPRLNPNALTPTDESPLMMAALKGQVEFARALIAKGGAVNKSGWAPLHYAATGGNTDMIRLLLDHRAAVEAPPLTLCRPPRLLLRLSCRPTGGRRDPRAVSIVGAPERSRRDGRAPVAGAPRPGTAQTPGPS